MDSDFVASLVGALVGGAIALVGVFWADWLQRGRDRVEEQKTLRGFLEAILTELETCWNRAESTSNPAIESLAPNQAFETEVFIETDFFTVYHNNSHYLGQVRDNSLRNQIVATITTYKALVETYNVNTRFFLQWQETKNLEFVTRDEELKRYYGRKAEYEYEKLRGWAVALRRDHFQLKQQIETLLPALRKAIEASDQPERPLRSYRELGSAVPPRNFTALRDGS